MEQYVGNISRVDPCPNSTVPVFQQSPFEDSAAQLGCIPTGTSDTVTDSALLRLEDADVLSQLWDEDDPLEAIDNLLMGHTALSPNETNTRLPRHVPHIPSHHDTRDSTPDCSNTNHEAAAPASTPPPNDPFDLPLTYRRCTRCHRQSMINRDFAKPHRTTCIRCDEDKRKERAEIQRTKREIRALEAEKVGYCMYCSQKLRVDDFNAIIGECGRCVVYYRKLQHGAFAPV